MATKEPLGGLVTTTTSFQSVFLMPQHSMAPSLWIPQVPTVPALTSLKVPGGGLDSPLLLTPQQSSVPSDLIAQAWPRRH